MWYHLSHARVLKLDKLVSIYLYIYIYIYIYICMYIYMYESSTVVLCSIRDKKDLISVMIVAITINVLLTGSVEADKDKMMA